MHKCSKDHLMAQRKWPSINQGEASEETIPGHTLIWTSKLKDSMKINFCCLSQSAVVGYGSLSITT